MPEGELLKIGLIHCSIPSDRAPAIARWLEDKFNRPVEVEVIAPADDLQGLCSATDLPDKHYYPIGATLDIIREMLYESDYLLIATPLHEEVRDQLRHDSDRVKPIGVIEDMREMIELAITEISEELGVDFDEDEIDELMRIIRGED